MGYKVGKKCRRLFLKQQNLDPEKQFCAWTGNEWSVSDIPPPPVLEAPPLPDLPPVEETEVEPESQELEPEPEPYVETYADKRLKEYGFVFEQLEFITENGLEAWQSKVAEIKKKYPKE